MITLSYHELFSMAFPFSLSTLPNETACTVCEVDHDRMLAFLLQGDNDEVHYLPLDLSNEGGSIPIAIGGANERITGMGYNTTTERIWTANGNPEVNRVFSFVPGTHQIVVDYELPPLSNPGTLVGGFGTNGLFYTRSYQETIELRTMGGTLLGSRTYPGRHLAGLSAAPNSWLACDSINHELLVIGPFGDIIATCPAPGSNAGSLAFQGLSSIAYNNLFTVEEVLNFLLGLGIISSVPPDLSWPGPGPEPWVLPHLIYTCNDIDRTIRCGYFIESP